MLRLGHVELFVKDPLASRRFYTEVLGFTEVVTQGNRFVWLDAGGLELLLRPGTGAAPASSYAEASTALVVYCDALEATAGKLRARGLEFHAAANEEEPDCLTFCDPDGHWFQLVDPGEHQ